MPFSPIGIPKLSGAITQHRGLSFSLGSHPLPPHSSSPSHNKNKKRNKTRCWTSASHTATQKNKTQDKLAQIHPDFLRRSITSTLFLSLGVNSRASLVSSRTPPSGFWRNVPCAEVFRTEYHQKTNKHSNLSNAGDHELEFVHSH
jgi:hypothetical protein